MSIRIGSSCALSKDMALGKCVETRILTDYTKWQEVAQYCISNMIYLIVTPCVNDNYGNAHIPSDSDWQTKIYSTCLYLKSIGAKNYNCRLSIINEPMKFISKEKYAQLINVAYPIIKQFGFLVGAGNEEFILSEARGGMYQYILANCKFDILDIHLQGSCDTKEKTEYWCNTARSWTTKPIDITEAFYGRDIARPDGWALLLAQLEASEDILESQNFCNVFNNLDTSAFPILSRPDVYAAWSKISFKVNNYSRSTYWIGWQELMDKKAPVPNIIIPKGKDGMIIKTIGHKETDVKNGYGCLLLNETLNFLIYLDDDYVNFEYSDKTRTALEQWQTAVKPLYNNAVDGRCGRMTWRYLKKEVKKIDVEAYKDLCDDLEIVMSPYNVEGDT